MQTFMDIVKTCMLDKFCTIQGRANRREFWLFYLFYFLISLLLLLIVASITWFMRVETDVFVFLCLLLAPVCLYIAIPLICLCVRRLHDLNWSGWLLLPLLIGSAYLIVFLFRGTDGLNRFDVVQPESREIIRRPFWRRAWFCALVLIAGLFVFTQIQLTETRITESSHFIVKPRLDNGEIDYYAAVMAPYQESLQNPESNGFRMILETVGPRLFTDFSSGKKQPPRPDYQSSSWLDFCRVFKLNPTKKGAFDDFLPLNADYLICRLSEEKRQASTAQNDSAEVDSDATSEDSPVDPWSLDLSGLNIDWEEYNRQNLEYKVERTKNGLYSRGEAKQILDFYLESLWHRPWSAAEHPLAAHWLEKNRPLLDLLARAVRQPNFTLYYSRPEQSLFELNTNPLAFCRLLGLSVALRIHADLGNGNIDQALIDLETIFRLGTALEQGPTTIDALSGMSLEQEGFSAVRQMLWESNSTDVQLSRLSEILRLPLVRPSFQQTAQKEFLVHYDLLQSFLRRSGSYQLDCSFEFAGLVSTVRPLIDENRFRAYHRFLCEPFITASNEPNLDKRNAAFQAAMDNYRLELVRSRDWFPGPLSWLTIYGRSHRLALNFFSLTCPLCEQIQPAFQRRDVRLRMARISVAAQRYKGQTGVYPESLSVLEQSEFWTDATDAAGIDFDPFTDRLTLCYSINRQTFADWQTQDQGRKIESQKDGDARYEVSVKPYYRPFLLYSLGKNGTDEKGEKSDYFEGDLIW